MIAATAIVHDLALYTANADVLLGLETVLDVRVVRTGEGMPVRA
jgi:hypothetical protein